MKNRYVVPQTEEMVLELRGIIMTSFDPSDPHGSGAPARRLGDIIE